MLTLPPDYTFLIQFAAFFVLLVVLTRTLFAPFLEVLDERAARTVGDVENAAATRAEVDTLTERIASELDQARAAAKADVDEVRAKTREESSRLLQEAQSSAAERLSQLREEVATATREARDSLEGEARSLADAMASAVIGDGRDAR